MDDTYFGAISVICRANASEFEGFFTEGLDYIVLEYDEDSHMILLQDDEEEFVWVEAELFYREKIA